MKDHVSRVGTRTTFGPWTDDGKTLAQAALEAPQLLYAGWELPLDPEGAAAVEAEGLKMLDWSVRDRFGDVPYSIADRIVRDRVDGLSRLVTMTVVVEG